MKIYIMLLLTVILAISSYSNQKKITVNGIYAKLQNYKFMSNSGKVSDQFNRFMDGSDEENGFSILFPLKNNFSLSAAYLENDFQTSIFDNFGISNFSSKYIGDSLDFDQKDLLLQVIKTFKQNEKLSYHLGGGLSYFQTDFKYKRNTSDSTDYYNLSSSDKILTSCISFGASYLIYKDVSISIDGLKNFGHSDFEFSPGDFSGDYFTSNTVYANESNTYSKDDLKYSFGDISLLLSVDIHFSDF